jgi:TPR repeat protein
MFDATKSVEEIRKAADQGDTDAQRNLGLRYRKGQGVPQDYQQAVEWYRKAADQGNAAAQFSLACMYGADLQTIICVLGMNGAGNNVPLDNHQATAWFCQRSL